MLQRRKYKQPSVIIQAFYFVLLVFLLVLKNEQQQKDHHFFFLILGGVQAFSSSSSSSSHHSSRLQSQPQKKSQLTEPTSSAAAAADTTSSATIRLNKVLKQTHSRRQADKLIAEGRVTVNDEAVHSAGQRVVPFVDIIKLDGIIVHGWEEFNHLSKEKKEDYDDDGNNNNKVKTTTESTKDTIMTSTFQYIKYWKPLGVTCTTDRRIKDNLIDALYQDGYYSTSSTSTSSQQQQQRIFPVGRLDKETSGLILLTSDGRLPNAALRGKYKQPKTYLVRVNKPVSEKDIQQLRDGVVITTTAQRDGNRGKPLTAPTLPCKVRPVVRRRTTSSSRVLEITLVEGRNRQIRKMLDALGYRVIALHRKTFMTLSLDPLEGPGDWEYLSKKEMEIVSQVISRADATAAAADNDDNDDEEDDM